MAAVEVGDEEQLMKVALQHFMEKKAKETKVTPTHISIVFATAPGQDFRDELAG